MAVNLAMKFLHSYCVYLFREGVCQVFKSNVQRSKRSSGFFLSIKNRFNGIVLH